MDSAARKDRRRQDAELRKRLQPMRRELERLEKEVARLGAEQAALGALLGDPAIYADSEKARLMQALADKARVDQQLSEAEAGWLELADALETAELEGN